MIQTRPGTRSTVSLQRRAVTVALLLLCIVATPTLAAKSKINTTLLGNLAVDGYDPVAYFTEGAPTKGSRKFTLEWQGANWRFASQESLDAFRSEPERYAPAYGGYCAWAVSQGYTAGIDPQAWRIVDGRLFLNYNRKVQKTWEADRANLIEQADRNWPQVLEK